MMTWMKKKMKTVCEHVHLTALHLVISCPQREHIKRQHPVCACATHDNSRTLIGLACVYVRACVRVVADCDDDDDADQAEDTS